MVNHLAYMNELVVIEESERGMYILPIFESEKIVDPACCKFVKVIVGIPARCREPSPKAVAPDMISGFVIFEHPEKHKAGTASSTSGQSSNGRFWQFSKLFVPVIAVRVAGQRNSSRTRQLRRA